MANQQIDKIRKLAKKGSECQSKRVGCTKIGKRNSSRRKEPWRSQHTLKAEAQHERSVVESSEGQALLDAAIDAVSAYSRFLERSGLIWGEAKGADGLRMKASALIITDDYGKADGISVLLKDGSLDRAYGTGTNPDPDGRGS